MPRPRGLTRCAAGLRDEKRQQAAADVLSFSSEDFLRVVRMSFERLLRLDLEYPGAVGELVAQVQFAVVAGAGLPHFADDFQPALAQAAQGVRVGFAALAQRRVVGLRPAA